MYILKTKFVSGNYNKLSYQIVFHEWLLFFAGSLLVESGGPFLSSLLGTSLLDRKETGGAGWSLWLCPAPCCLEADGAGPSGLALPCPVQPGRLMVVGTGWRPLALTLGLLMVTRAAGER